MIEGPANKLGLLFLIWFVSKIRIQLHFPILPNRTCLSTAVREFCSFLLGLLQSCALPFYNISYHHPLLSALPCNNCCKNASCKVDINFRHLLVQGLLCDTKQPDCVLHLCCLWMKGYLSRLYLKSFPKFPLHMI